MADSERHWADPIVLNFNIQPPSSELRFVNCVGPDSLYKLNEVRESGRTRQGLNTTSYKYPDLFVLEKIQLYTKLTGALVINFPFCIKSAANDTPIIF